MQPFEEAAQSCGLLRANGRTIIEIDPNTVRAEEVSAQPRPSRSPVRELNEEEVYRAALSRRDLVEVGLIRSRQAGPDAIQPHGQRRISLSRGRVAARGTVVLE